MWECFGRLGYVPSGHVLSCSISGEKGSTLLTLPYWRVCVNSSDVAEYCPSARDAGGSANRTRELWNRPIFGGLEA